MSYSPGGDLQSVTIPISSAEIKTLFSVGKTLIAAPGANKAIIPSLVLVRYIFGTTQYTLGGNISYRYTNLAGFSIGTIITGTVFNGYTADNLNSSSTGPTTIISNLVNQPIVLTAATQDFATGDGTLQVIIYYRVIAV